MRPATPFQDLQFNNSAEFFLKIDGNFVEFPDIKDGYNGSCKVKNKKGCLYSPLNNCRESTIKYIKNSLYGVNELLKANSYKNYSFCCEPMAIIDEKPVYARGGITLSTYTGTSNKSLVENVETTVKLMDYVAGNTLVLCDQKYSAALIESRKHVGMAGDYETNTGSINYKVPSNYFLSNCVLFSLMSGLVRTGHSISTANEKDNDYLSAFMSLVSYDDIIKAINNNDAELARKNFDKISNLLCEACYNVKYESTCANFFPITKFTLPYFIEFVNQGMDYWFNKPNMYDDIMSYGSGGTTHYGIERFLTEIVSNDLAERKFKLKNTSIIEIWSINQEKKLDKSEGTFTIDGMATA